MSAEQRMNGRPRGGVREPHMSKEELKSSLGKGSTVWRLFRFIFKNYKIRIGIVLVCIVVSALATLASSLFTKTLIDDYITPMLSMASPDYSPLAVALFKLGAVLLVGVVASYSYNLIMIFVGQGTMLRLRENLFSHMEDLPLSYFDSHSHGDIMSVYTNDVDTLRQVIGSTLPNLFQSLITLISTFVSMIVLSVPLTLVSILMAILTVRVTTALGKISKGHFVERQKNLGKVNGYIEEMVSGQRVVKVYCHEKKAVEDFTVLNEQLRSSAYNANKVGSMVMPINGNIGNRQYLSSATSDIVGDLDIEIKLNRKGQLRLTLFSHSADQYSNYLDMSQRNGAGIVYQEDFNTIGDLWRKIFHIKKDDERRERLRNHQDLQQAVLHRLHVARVLKLGNRNQRADCRF